MDITFNCDHCGQHIVIDEAATGLQVQCPKCAASITVPNNIEPATSSAPTPSPGKQIVTKASRVWATLVVILLLLCAGIAWLLFALQHAQHHWTPPTSEWQDWLENPKPEAGQVEKLQRQAEAGGANAQFILGMLYADGRGVPQNNAEALKWIRKAAEEGNAMAQVVLASYYEKGKLVSQNHSEAEKLRRKAAKSYLKLAKAGNAEAQDRLAYLYEEGVGVTKNNDEAVKWHHRSTESYRKCGWQSLLNVDNLRELASQL